MERINAVGISLFGKGAIGLLPEELMKNGYKRALIVTDKFLYESGAAEKVGDELLKANIEYAIYYEVRPNPTTDVVNECIEAAKCLKVDLLVAVGGGSAIDTCKAVSIVNANGGSVEDYEGNSKSKKKGTPIVAVNTTAGTGSEVTSFYIVTDTKRHSKMCMYDINCMVSIAVNDIDFMVGMPKSLTASTGMDAMTHAIEAKLSRSSNPLTDKDALWSITTIKNYLPLAYKDGNNIKAREMMAYAENTAGMAFSNSGLGIVHSMAHALGGFYNLPHGVCNAVLLPYVLKFNGKSVNTHEDFKEIALSLQLDGAERFSGKEAVDKTVEYIKRMSEELGIPKRLSELKGVNEKDFESLAKLAINDACTASNPVDVSISDIISIYREAY